MMPTYKLAWRAPKQLGSRCLPSSNPGLVLISAKRTWADPTRSARGPLVANLAAFWQQISPIALSFCYSSAQGSLYSLVAPIVKKVLPSGTLSGALLVNRAGRSGLAIKSWPKATASASPSAMTWFACASVYFSFAMNTPPNCFLSCGPNRSGPKYSRANRKPSLRLPSSRAT